MQVRKMQLRSSIKIALLAVAIAFGFVLYANPALAAEGVDNAIDAKVEIELLEANVKPDNLIEEDTVKVAPNSDYTKVNIYYKKCSTDNTNNTNNTNNKQNNKTEKTAGKKAIAPTGDTATKTAVVVGLSLVGILSMVKGRDMKKTLGVLVVVLGLAAISTAPCAYATNTAHKIGDVVKLDVKSNQEITYKAPEIEGYEVMGYTIESNPFTIKYIDAFDEANPQVLAEYKAELNEATPECDKAMPEHAGFKFSGWEPQVDKTVTKNCEYKAQWDVSTCKVSATSNELGKVAVDNIVVKHGGSAKVTFAANEGSKLVKVLVNDSEIDLTEIKDNTLKLDNITQDKTIKAEFALKLTPVVPIPNVNTELIEVKVGTEITNDTYLNAVKLADDATNDLIDSVELIGDGIDTSKINKGSVKVKVTFESGSSCVVDVEYSVFDEPGTIIPIPSITTQKITLTQFDKVDNSTYLLGIKDLPEGAKVEPKDNPITTESVHEGKTKVKVIFSDGSARPVDIDYEVIPLVCTVTYKDGLGGELFKDQVFKVNYGDKTPKFMDKLDYDGYKFKGWRPSIAETVTEKNTVYTAKWIKVHTVTVNLATQKVFGLDDKYEFIDDEKAITNSKKTKAEWRESKRKEYAKYIDFENLGLYIDGVMQDVTIDDLNEKGQLIFEVKDRSWVWFEEEDAPKIDRYFSFAGWDSDNDTGTWVDEDWVINANWDDTWYFYMDEDTGEGIITLDKSEYPYAKERPEWIPNSVKTIKCEKPIILYKADELFTDCGKLDDISGLENWDTSNVTSMYATFRGCKSLADISGLSEWDTSNVTSMGSMFSECKSLSDTSGLSKWDTSDVTGMSWMFVECENLSDTSGLSKWDTSNVTDMRSTFKYCKNLTDISSLANWDMSKVIKMNEMFKSCKKLDDTTPLEKWNTSNVINMSGVFQHCYGLTNAKGLAKWNTSKVEDMSWMFQACTNLVDISALSEWDTSNVTNMQSMFFAIQSEAIYECPMKLADISPLSNWDTSNVKNMSSMFATGTSKYSGNISDISALSEWKTSNVTNMNFVFSGNQKISDLSALENWDTSNVTDMRGTFSGCKSLADISALSKWDTSNVKYMQGTFRGCKSLADISGLSEWDTSNVTNMSSMFASCENLTDVSPLEKWDTSNVTNMSWMFASCENLTDVSPLENWNTSNVEYMRRIFWNVPAKLPSWYKS